MKKPYTVNVSREQQQRIETAIKFIERGVTTEDASVMVDRSKGWIVIAISKLRPTNPLRQRYEAAVAHFCSPSEESPNLIRRTRYKIERCVELMEAGMTVGEAGAKVGYKKTNLSGMAARLSKTDPLFKRYKEAATGFYRRKQEEYIEKARKCIDFMREHKVCSTVACRELGYASGFLKDALGKRISAYHPLQEEWYKLSCQYLRRKL